MPDEKPRPEKPELVRMSGTRVPARQLKAGDVVHLTRAASPQFIRPIFVRIIREMVGRFPPYGWIWIDCYELDAKGAALAKRELFVLREGIVWQDQPERMPARRRPMVGTPARVG